MNVILCGYNWAGCKALEFLVKQKFNVYVFTHSNPDYVNSLVDYCEKLGVKYSLEKITNNNIPFKPDVICSIYYRYIIDVDVIKCVNGKIFNLHPSLLPKYKGCSSLSWAMINGEIECGFTFHYIEPKVDNGNIIIQKKISIEDFDTGSSLYLKVMFYAMEYFNKVFSLVNKGDLGVRQSDLGASYYRRGAPFNGQIDINWDDNKKDRFIRAMNYQPLPPAKIGEKEIRILKDLKNHQ
jgi:UDP-4-amino-4-deoxy-L-arabinose formyltransferase/UDP-glucuronic acid dehydrogenase (UDP-4-keto-hexauronic acid decarboxylating)